jgi:CRP-like cAMP-binding protein
MDPKRLKDVPLFQGLSGKDLSQLGQWTDEVDIPQGKHLAEQGTFAYEFFVIEDGTAEVTRDGESVGTLGAGDFFGEIGLLESERRTATVVATSPMRLVVMTGRDFTHMESEMPHVAEQVRQRIQERLARDRGE